MTARPLIEFRGIRVADLKTNRGNVREHLDGIDDLAASIRANGILQPLIVNDLAGELIVTDGHRRLEAARRAQVPVVPCLVTTDADERTVVTTMLAAAMHKELRPIEQGRAFARLRGEGMTLSDIARSTGYSQALISNRLLLLELPDEAQDMVDDDTLTIAQATDLAKQVKQTRSGSTAVREKRTHHFDPTHPLYAKVAGCAHESRIHYGNVACGPCWEAAIRADALGQDVGLDEGDFDWVAVERFLGGDRSISLTHVMRRQVVRRLHGEGRSDSDIAGLIGCDERQVLRDRRRLGLPANPHPNSPTSSGDDRGVA